MMRRWIGVSAAVAVGVVGVVIAGTAWAEASRADALRTDASRADASRADATRADAPRTDASQAGTPADDNDAVADVTPDAPTAEAQFIDALLRHPERRLDTLQPLTEASLGAEPRPRDLLLLGLNHLWIVAEGDTADTERFDHAVLAQHWLERAEAAMPWDTRIPTWRHSAAFTVARLEGRNADAEQIREHLRALADDDPCFHAVTLGIVSFDEPRDSTAFRQAADAMEASFECNQDDPSAQDHPLWPHNVHAYLVALSDFRLKAGDLAGAEAALVIAEARPGFAEWKHRALVDDRFTDLGDRARRFGNDDPHDDPPFVFAAGSPVSCIGCHGE